MLPTRGDGAHSWTVDLTAKRAAAREARRCATGQRQARRHQEKDQESAAQAALLVDKDAIEALRTSKALDGGRASSQTRPTPSDAVYDLKAVNPTR